MKPLAAIVIAFLLTGCATAPNGRTYWDVDATLKATHAAVEILQGSRKPQGYEQLYDADGEPVDP